VAQVQTKEVALNIDATIAVNDSAWVQVMPNLRFNAEAVVKHTLAVMSDSLPDMVRSETGEPIGLAIVFTDNKEMQELNHRFRGKNVPTNVLSFPADMDAPQPAEQEIILGDVILAYGVVAEEAEEQGKPLAHHMTHMIVHGLLHLLGYDHMDDEEAEEMEAYECRILADFGIPDPYENHAAFMTTSQPKTD
jgi:probable rRNA maturation factor